MAFAVMLGLLSLGLSDSLQAASSFSILKLVVPNGVSAFTSMVVFIGYSNVSEVVTSSLLPIASIKAANLAALSITLPTMDQPGLCPTVSLLVLIDLTFLATSNGAASYLAVLHGSKATSNGALPKSYA